MDALAFGGPESLLVLLLALMVDAAFGDLRLRTPWGSPATAARRLADQADRRLNRLERSEKDRLIRGTLVALGLAAGLAGVGALISLVARTVPYGVIAEIAAMAICLDLRRAWMRLRRTRAAIDTGSLDDVQASIVGLTRRDPANLDRHGAARVAVEAAAHALNRRVVAPVFWFLLFGLPGAFLWRTVDAVDDVIGRRGLRYERFGLTAARLDAALNYLPARITALMVILAAVFVGSTRPLGAIRTIWRDARVHPSVNSAWPVGAFAGALDAALAGPHRQGAVTVNELWIGQGRARLVPSDLDRALALYFTALLILVFGLAALMAGLAGLDG